MLPAKNSLLTYAKVGCKYVYQWTDDMTGKLTATADIRRREYVSRTDSMLRQGCTFPEMWSPG